MPTQILMPALSPTMTEGKLAKWLKREGDAVKSGDVIAEIETDKATMEMEAVDEGVLGKILVPAGTEKVQVNQPIAVLLDEGEKASDVPAAPKPRCRHLRPRRTATAAPPAPEAAQAPAAAGRRSASASGSGKRPPPAQAGAIVFSPVRWRDASPPTPASISRKACRAADQMAASSKPMWRKPVSGGGSRATGGSPRQRNRQRPARHPAARCRQFGQPYHRRAELHDAQDHREASAGSQVHHSAFLPDHRLRHR